MSHCRSLRPARLAAGSDRLFADATSLGLNQKRTLQDGSGTVRVAADKRG